RKSGRPKQLIAIFQRGAVDGLSVVVPFGESEYYRARPSIAIPRPNSGENAAVDLDGFFGFNPRLQALKPLWDARQLAIVHACGSPDSTRSHFDAQDYMETATPGGKNTAADRVLSGTGREAFDAIKMLKVADPGKYQPEHGADYPRSAFGQALKQI